MEARKRSASAVSKQNETQVPASSLGLPLGSASSQSAPSTRFNVANAKLRQKKSKKATVASSVVLCSLLCVPVSVALLLFWFILIPLFQLQSPTSPQSIRYDVDRILHHPPGMIEITSAIRDWVHVDVRATHGQEDDPFARRFLPQRPRVMGHYYEYSQAEQSSSLNFHGTEQLDSNTIYLPRAHGGLKLLTVTQESQGLHKSKDYWYGMADPFEDDKCVKRYDYQMDSKPTCNLLMEQDLTDLQSYMEWITEKQNDGNTNLVKHSHIAVKLLSNGYWRDVWQIYDQGRMVVTPVFPESYRPNKAVLKTIRYEHDYEERNYDRHRRDAVAMERLTSSPNVMDIYAFCGNSGLFEFADGGSIEQAIWDEGGGAGDWTPKERLAIAAQLARGLHDLHTVDNPHLASISHADITTSQYVFASDGSASGGRYKLNDFNRCRFLRRNITDNSNCPFHVGNNPGKFRAPEEYRYDLQTEKIDVYSLGNIFYGMLTSNWPFDEHSDKTAQKKVMAGERPEIGPEFIKDDPYNKALMHATHWCWTHDPKKRPSATEVLKFLENVLEGKSQPV